LSAFPNPLPEREELLGLALAHLLEHLEDLLREPLADLGDVSVLLEHLPRHVERQVDRVDDPLHEP
jgi:hypothetical protein